MKKDIFIGKVLIMRRGTFAAFVLFAVTGLLAVLCFLFVLQAPPPINHPPVSLTPFYIAINLGDSPTQEILKHIEISRTISRNDDDFWEYFQNRIAEITSFYSIDNFKIDGYRLVEVDIVGPRKNEYGFSYKFAPNSVSELNGGSFYISIYPMTGTGFEKRDPNNPLKGLLELFGGHLTEDGMLYSQNSLRTDIYAVLNDEWFINISPPNYLSEFPADLSELPAETRIEDGYAEILSKDKEILEAMHSYEYLRDLALQVIKAAELIQVRQQ